MADTDNCLNYQLPVKRDFEIISSLRTAKEYPLTCAKSTRFKNHEAQSRDMIIAQSDAHNFDAARSMLNSLTQTDSDAAHDARRLTYNCSVLVNKAMASV